jgi:uncharacterized protein YbgA (DUF1722 family)/uncharacterized protein YbbK (DUF523 family)
MRELRIGISSCLLGREVRYDGGHKQDRFLIDVLGKHVRWVPVCPEVEVGMGVPREAIRLEGNADAPRLLGVRSRTDHTEAMRAFARRRTRELDAHELCGYVLKKDSPSCGLERVRLVTDAGTTREGIGMFARALIEHAPLLPVEEEGRLNDPRLRENWIERVFAYHRFRELAAQRFSRGALVAFHTAHKFQLLSHGTAPYQALGRLVAQIAAYTPTAFLSAYGEAFMSALRAKATPARHVNVLQHVAGFFKQELSTGEKRELEEVLADYRAGLVPLVVPITLVRHHARAHGTAYILAQTYLSPHPKELALRSC